MALFYASEDKSSNYNTLKRAATLHSTGTHGANNSIDSLCFPNYKKEYGNLCIANHTSVPESHKRVADSYVFVRQIFGTPVVHSSLSEEEKQLLLRFDFYPLEYTTSNQMEQELSFLKKWSNEKDLKLREAADQIVHIRAKELKHIIATNYVSVKRDLYDGYRILDRYFQEISKYNRK
jgi:hypothetical protein